MWCGFHTNDVWLSHVFISHVACGYHTTPFCVDLTQLSVCVEHMVCLTHTVECGNNDIHNNDILVHFLDFMYDRLSKGRVLQVARSETKILNKGRV